MKKTIVTLMVMLSFGLVTQSKPANAGIIFTSLGVICAIGGAGGCGVATLPGIAMWVIGANVKGMKEGAAKALVILDGSSQLSSTQMQERLREAYPFIDNTLALQNLARVVQNKIDQQGKQDSYLVTLTQEELNLALASADLTEKEMVILAEDFR